MITLKRMLLGVFFLVCSASSVGAVRIAVFPVEDLSLGRNGVNLEFTSYIAKQLQSKQVEIIPDRIVHSYLARNRIRWAGYLDSDSILSADKEFGADYILFGTLRKNMSPGNLSLPSFGMTLFLVSTNDAQIVWTYSKGISRTDVQNLLGIEEPKTGDELLGILVKDVLDSWPGKLDFSDKQMELIEIDNVSLEPKYVQPGGLVRCSIRLKKSSLRGNPEVMVKAGNNLYYAKEHKSRHLFEVSWKGSDILMAQMQDKGIAEKGLSVKASKVAYQSSDQYFSDRQYYQTLNSENISTDQTNTQYAPGIILATTEKHSSFPDVYSDMREPDTYESFFAGAGVDGSYPVSLLLKWPNGRQKVVFLGTYYVDGSPPNVKLNLKGKVLNGQIAFADQLVVLPRMNKPEPVSRWEVVIMNDAGDEVVKQDGKGKLPKRFAWTGKTGSGSPAVEGEYTISLRTWDRADNMAIVSDAVSLANRTPEIVLEAKKNDSGIALEFRYEGEVPLSYWRLELRAKDGALVKQIEDASLPFSVDISKEMLSEAVSIECFIKVRDILGNLSKNKTDDLALLADKQQKNIVEEREPEDVTEAWVEEF